VPTFAHVQRRQQLLAYLLSEPPALLTISIQVLEGLSSLAWFVLCSSVCAAAQLLESQYSYTLLPHCSSSNSRVVGQATTAAASKKSLDHGTIHCCAYKRYEPANAANAAPKEAASVVLALYTHCGVGQQKARLARQNQYCGLLSTMFS
jgi:hypothetical protein